MRIITRQLQPKPWIRPFALLFLLASLLPVVLIGPPSPARGRAAAITTKPPKSPVPLRGEEPIAQLKQERSYDSLAAAMAATRYQLQWVEQPTLAGVGSAWQATNPAQGMQAYFTPGAIRIAKHDTPPATTDNGKPAKQ